MSAPEWSPVDWYPGLACTTDGTYLYGLNFGFNNIVERFDPSSGAITQLADFGTNIGVLTLQCMTNGTMFACVGNNDLASTSAQTWQLYRSVNKGATWASVSILGAPDGGGGQVAGVAIQNCASLAELTINGVRTLFYGEYNINTARVAGGANDEVKIMRSVDDGVTWTKVIKWNTAGSNIVTHCHAVKALNGRLLILNGDGLGSGIIEWNPTATAGVWTVADNATYATIGGTTGYAALFDLTSTTTNEVFRATDMLYRPQDNMYYWMTDSGLARRGIYACRPGLTGLSLRDTKQLASHEGYYGVINSSGAMTIVTSTFSGATDKCHFVFASDDGWDWRIVGRHSNNKAVTATVPQAVFLFGNSLVISSKDGARKRDRGTTLCNIVGDFIDEVPANIAPCFWVAPGGINRSVNETIDIGGWSPRSPLADPGYPLTSLSNRVTYGSRIMVAPGTYTNNRVSMNWTDTGTRDAESGINVQVTGAGKTLTRWVHDGADASLQLFYIAAGVTNHKLDVRNLHSYLTNGSGATSLATSDEPTTGLEFTARDCVLGHPANGFATSIGVLRPDLPAELRMVLHRCVVCSDPAVAGTNAVFFRQASSYLRAYATVFYGGNSATMNITRATTDIELFNCLFIGVTNAAGTGIAISGAATIPPVLKNVLFDVPAAATSINDTLNLAGWSSTNHNGIAYTKAFSGANLLAAIAAGANLSLVGQPTGLTLNLTDFTLSVSGASQLLGRGSIYQVLKDFNRGTFRAPATIGPVEYLPDKRAQVLSRAAATVRATGS